MPDHGELLKSELVIIVTLIIGFLSTLAAQVVTWKKAARDRQWDREDRAEIAKRAVEQAEIVEQKLHASHATLHAQLAHIIAEVQEGSTHAKAAYREANHVNEKIADLQQTLVNQGDTRD